MKLETLNRRLQKHYGQTELVFGEGRKEAEIMLVGEAPGKDEVASGRPFCGRAGKNLEDFLKIPGLDRDQLYISNVCKFRPFRVSEKGTVSNRPPTKREVAEAVPFLREEILAVRPRLIVTLGNTPLRACWGDFSKNVGAEHGTLKTVVIGGNRFLLFSLYHPASILYNPSLQTVYLEDLQSLKNCVRSMTEE